MTERGCVPAVQRRKTPVSFPCSSLGHVSALPCSEQSLVLSSNQNIRAQLDFDTVSKPALWYFQVTSSVGVAQPVGSLHGVASAA